MSNPNPQPAPDNKQTAEPKVNPEQAKQLENKLVEKKLNQNQTTNKKK